MAWGRYRTDWTVLLHWAHLALGNFFSVNISLKEDHKLITGGPYRYVRHPIYTALALFFLGTALSSANLLIAGLNLILTLLLFSRIGREEKLMEIRFGESYVSYAKQTGCLLPRLPFRPFKAA